MWIWKAHPIFVYNNNVEALNNSLALVNMTTTNADAEVDVKLQDWERACIALRLGEKGILRAALGQLKTLDWASLESDTE